MPEPTPLRDTGPYFTRIEALAQAAAELGGLPCTPNQQANVVLRRALLTAGVELSPYEDDRLDDLTQSGHLDPADAQLIAGWLARGALVESRYLQGRHDQAEGTVDTDRTQDRAYVAGLAAQRTAALDRALAAGADPALINDGGRRS